MSTVIRGLQYKRFVRQVRTDKAELVSTQATLDAGYELLKVAPWRQARNDLSITMPASDPTATASSDAYDAYKFSGDCVANSGKQAAFLGMAAYRFKLPDDAQNVGAHDNVTLATIKAYSNKFLAAGLCVTAFINDFETPGEIFTTGDADTIFNSYRVGITNLSAVLPETAEHQAGTKTAVNGAATLNVVASTTEAAKYLWIFVQLWDWTQIKWEYWIEGAGFLDAASINVTFDRTGVTPDTIVETFEFPVDLTELEEPSKVYPLQAIPLPVLAQWGYGLTALPTTGLTDVVKVVTSYDNTMALNSDGSIVGWGNPANEMLPIPAIYQTGNKDIAMADRCCAVLRMDGTVAGWGTHNAVPAMTGVASIVLYGINGTDFGLALKTDGTVQAWGADAGGVVSTIPALSGIVQVACSLSHALALRSDGLVQAWGDNTNGENTMPAGLSGVIKVAHGVGFCLALKSDGTVVSWGSNANGCVAYANTLTNCCDIAGHWEAVVALKTDGTLVGGGSGSYGDYVVGGVGSPTNVYAIFGSVYRAFALSASTKWYQSKLNSLAYGLIPITASDADVKRELAIRRLVDTGENITTTTHDSGTYGIDTTTGAGLSMAVKKLGYGFRATNQEPNRLHICIPALSADATEGEIYCRVCLLKDNNASPVNPVATAANWQTVWNGGTPTGYSLLASEYIRHTGFVNSHFIEMQDPGDSGTCWLVIMPIHIPLAEDSVTWDVTQTGWDADAVFMYRD